MTPEEILKSLENFLEREYPDIPFGLAIKAAQAVSTLALDACDLGVKIIPSQLAGAALECIDAMESVIDGDERKANEQSN